MRRRRGSLAFLAAAVWSCAARPSPPPTPGPAREAVPESAAPLTIDIVYPVDSQFVSARDSTFVFGSVSHPRAEVFVGGIPVEVHSNGAFLAWVPIPREHGDTSALFQAVAVTDGIEATTATRWVRVPRKPLDLPGDALAVDTTSFSVQGVVWALPDEPLRLTVRATPGAAAWVEWPGGERFVLAEREAIERAVRGELTGPAVNDGRSQGSVYAGEVAARGPLGRGAVEPARLPPPPLPPLYLPRDTAVAGAAGGGGGRPAAGVGPEGEAGLGRAAAQEAAGVRADTLPRAVLGLARGGDTLRVPIPLDLWVLDPYRLPVVASVDAPSPTGTDGIVYGRPTAQGTYVWFFHDGQRLQVSGREGDRLRVRLGPDLHAWIDRTEQVPLPEGTPPPQARVQAIEMAPRPQAVDVRISLGDRVPYLVTEGGRRVELTLYSAYSETDWVYYGEARSFVREARWRQDPGGVFVLTLELEDEPWGYRVEQGDESLTLTVRRPPAIERGDPLRGRKIAVDPGHPPGGATGPTRLYEGDVNLAIALRLKEMLEDEGAEVLLTRTHGADSVPLYARPLIAESANAEILVSIHNNALPDGIRPFDRHGTMVFYFHPHSVDLARALQEQLLRTLGLRDLGIGRANLALARGTWMPAALTEGAFIMIPEQEALLRTPEFQERYARGVLKGIEGFLKRRTRRD